MHHGEVTDNGAEEDLGLEAVADCGTLENMGHGSVTDNGAEVGLDLEALKSLDHEEDQEEQAAMAEQDSQVVLTEQEAMAEQRRGQTT